MLIFKIRKKNSPSIIVTSKRFPIPFCSALDSL